MDRFIKSEVMAEATSVLKVLKIKPTDKEQQVDYLKVDVDVACMHTFYLSAHPKLKKSVACVAVMSVDIAQKAVTKLTEFHVLRHFLEYYRFSLIQPVKLTDSLGNKYIS